jgi:hypothetical protein
VHPWATTSAARSPDTCCASRTTREEERARAELSETASAYYTGEDTSYGVWRRHGDVGEHGGAERGGSRVGGKDGGGSEPR